MLDTLATLLFSIGAAFAVALLVALALSILAPRRVRIWPTPGDGSWQGYVWWPLFRGLNVLCFAVAALDGGARLGVPPALRMAALAVLAASIAGFVYAFRRLGRDNSYCATDGLVTGGIYQWSRNPQNALLVVVYAALAIAANSQRAGALCAAMAAVYVLMVLAEEPWLEEAYGDAYRRYCSEVPRFFHWRRLAGTRA